MPLYDRCAGCATQGLAPCRDYAVRLRYTQLHAVDCAACETKEGKSDRIESEITLDGALTEAQQAHLLQIAGRCPVPRTSTSAINIRTQLVKAYVRDVRLRTPRS
jgi:putative redox protein